MNNACQPPSTKVYVIRHGETEWNRAGRWQGHLDSPLTTAGIHQAQQVAQGLSGQTIDVLYSSDLGRARQTADIIGKALHLNVITEPRLREKHLGIAQGLTVKEVTERYPAEYQQLKSNDPDYAFPEGESRRQHGKRISHCCNELVQRHPSQTILLVTHGGSLNRLFYWTQGIPLDAPCRFATTNCAINQFVVSESTWQLEVWGDTAHL